VEADTNHSTVVGMEEIHYFLRLVMPKVNVATVAATDNELAVWAVEVDSLHCIHNISFRLFLDSFSLQQLMLQ